MLEAEGLTPPVKGGQVGRAVGQAVAGAQTPRQIGGLFNVATKFKHGSCIQAGHSGGPATATGAGKGAWSPAPHFPAHLLGEQRSHFNPIQTPAGERGRGGKV